MPTFSRKSLRQSLGLNHLRDTQVGTTTATGPAVVDQFGADTSFSGQVLYERSWLKHNGMELRVATFNVGSGAYLSGMVLGTLVLSGSEYERHDLVRPSEKDRAIDDAVKRMRLRREVGLPSVDGAFYYAIDFAATPALIVDESDVMDVYYYANPTNSLNRDRRQLDNWDVERTGSGLELRIAPRLSGSYQIVLDALITLTLGSADTATINIPDERLVLFGAEAQCWHALAKTAPGTQRESYVKSRDEAARAYSDLAAKFKRPVERNLQFDRVVGNGSPSNGWW